jgi:hypothetical protein
LWRLSKARLRPENNLQATLLYPAVAGSLTAMIVGDLFVQYPKFELRFWFLTLTMVLLGMVAAMRRVPTSEAASTSIPIVGPAQTGAGGPRF